MDESQTRVREIGITARENADGQLRVEVSDSGPGISPDIQRQLFTAFVTTKAQGLGIGLSICHTIVAAHGGRLWVQPRSGAGATFCFTLPSVAGQ
jgi:two-component system sensor kinase FixL